MGDLFTPTHLIIVLAIALVVLGPKRLPELGAGLGKSLREFREATSGVTGAFAREAYAAPPPAPRPEPVTAPAPQAATPPGEVDSGG
ncbi:MAG: twin-arginine translocase TatA/TatE family subunit [Candidatus Rokubacteria bacterium]|nr:twin-arginine translocase TatA/TatE family subunit [Candidatus Rokubacteria bacterium]